MNFIAQSFEIALYDFETKEYRKKVMEGVVAEGTGLGYYKELDYPEYVVTHLASGYNLGYVVFSELDVQLWIESLVSLWDWHMSAKEVFALSKDDRAKVKKTLQALTDDYMAISEVLSKRRVKALWNAAKAQAMEEAVK